MQGNPSLSSKPAGAPFGSGVPPLPPPTHPAYRAPTSKAGNKWILHPNLPIDVRFLTVWTVVMSFAAWSMYDELQARSHQREVKKAEERERMKELMAAKTEVRHLGSEVRHLKDEVRKTMVMDSYALLCGRFIKSSTYPRLSTCRSNQSDMGLLSRMDPFFDPSY